MPRIKTIDPESTPKPLATEKIIEVDEAEGVIELDEKTEVVVVPGTEQDEEEADEEDALDTEEIDPFGDTWEQ
jgi:hypothetical protein